MRLINISIGAANAAAAVAVAVDAFVIVLTVASLLPIISANDSSNRELSDPSTINPGESIISSAANLHIKRSKIMDATYEQVKDVPNHPEIYLIDVRNPEELTATGSIPSSLNVPCVYKLKLNTLYLCIIFIFLLIFSARIGGSIKVRLGGVRKEIWTRKAGK